MIPAQEAVQVESGIAPPSPITLRIYPFPRVRESLGPRSTREIGFSSAPYDPFGYVDVVVEVIGVSFVLGLRARLTLDC